jgi:hypothetical protein
VEKTIYSEKPLYELPGTTSTGPETDFIARLMSVLTSLSTAGSSNNTKMHISEPIMAPIEFDREDASRSHDRTQCQRRVRRHNLILLPENRKLGGILLRAIPEGRVRRVPR